MQMRFFFIARVLPFFVATFFFCLILIEHYVGASQEHTLFVLFLNVYIRCIRDATKKGMYFGCCTYNSTFDKAYTFGQGIACHGELFDYTLIAFADATRVNERTNRMFVCVRAQFKENWKLCACVSVCCMCLCA